MCAGQGKEEGAQEAQKGAEEGRATKGHPDLHGSFSTTASRKKKKKKKKKKRKRGKRESKTMKRKRKEIAQV